MTRDALEKLRLGVPGVIIVIGTITLVSPSPAGIVDIVAKAGLEDYTVPGLAVLLSGTIYFVFDVRSFFLGSFWHDVDSNIKAQLLACLRGAEPITDQQAAYLNSGNRLLDIFYMIVDNDASLHRNRTITLTIGSGSSGGDVREHGLKTGSPAIQPPPLWRLHRVVSVAQGSSVFHHVMQMSGAWRSRLTAKPRVLRLSVAQASARGN